MPYDRPGEDGKRRPEASLTPSAEHRVYGDDKVGAQAPDAVRAGFSPKPMDPDRPPLKGAVRLPEWSQTSDQLY